MLKSGAWLSKAVLAGWILAVAPVGRAEPPASAPAAGDLAEMVRCELHCTHDTVRAGESVWVEFRLTNLTDRPVSLSVPNWSDNRPNTGIMGLPLEHVFSGKAFTALVIQDNRGGVPESPINHRPQGPVPIVELAPKSSVGLWLELTQYYRLLRQYGEYRLIWRPYNGILESAPLTINVLAEQQAIIDTNYGKMTMRFYYNEAPNHAKNFIELVNQRFYNNKTFHRVVPDALIQGGCPHGDGYGVREDGKRLKAEFNKIPFEAGTVGMARSPKDPDSASCQFYICLGRQPAFDGQQTAFGYLLGQPSFETLHKIAAVPTSGYPKFRPLDAKKVYIRSISLENIPLEERADGRGLNTGPATTRPGAADGDAKANHRPSTRPQEASRTVLSVLPRSKSTTRPATGTAP